MCLPIVLQLIVEYMEAGSLWDVLHNREAPPMSWFHRALVLRQTALGMVYLHNREEEVLHRDLKSPNLLLNSSFTCKVCDFGMSKLGRAGATNIIGTPNWTAPEVFLGQPHTAACDVWSFGVVVWETVSRACPYGRQNPVKLVSSLPARCTVQKPWCTQPLTA